MGFNNDVDLVSPIVDVHLFILMFYVVHTIITCGYRTTCFCVCARTTVVLFPRALLCLHMSSPACHPSSGIHHTAPHMRVICVLALYIIRIHANASTRQAPWLFVPCPVCVVIRCRFVSCRCVCLCLCAACVSVCMCVVRVRVHMHVHVRVHVCRCVCSCTCTCACI